MDVLAGNDIAQTNWNASKARKNKHAQKAKRLYLGNNGI